jgi:tripartite-type tricarboxylate transporter receptor subunit TctC
MKCLSKFLVAAAAAGALALPAVAVAQTYPTKPIKLIVPMPAGGATDFVGRTVAESMRQDLGQMIAVENKPGAAARIGIETARMAPADGYTLVLVLSNSHGLAPALRKDLPYDPIADFTPIGVIATGPMALIIRSSLPIKTLPELIDYAKRNPGKLTFASSGLGSGSHLQGEMLKHLAGIDIVHVPYKGTAPAMNDLLAGHVDLYFEGSAVKPHVDDGKLRILAAAGPKRWFLYPDVPTTAEQGLPGLVSQTWWGLMGPKGLPQPIVDRLNSSLLVALKDPKVRSAMETQGVQVVTETSPAQMVAFIASEIERWKANLKMIGYVHKAGN